MKILKLIVHKSCQQELSDKLKTSGCADNFTFTHVEGHGIPEENNPTLSIEDLVVGYIPKISVDILVDESKLKNLLDTVQSIKGVKGQGVYWVVSADRFGEL